MMARGNSRPVHAWGRRTLLAAGVALCALVCAATGAAAQGAAAINPLPASVSVPPDAKLFLEADTVTYESDAAVVTAAGGVQIDYGNYKLVAKKVIYNQKTRRLIATGDVQLVQPDGNKVYADSADITDDFADGFVRALRIETPDNTRFAAQGAVRENGSVTTFEKGIYTACEACREHPERAPLWQVRARKIVWDQQKKVVRYYGAAFEFFGAPLAYLPYFAQPDPTVKRKSGFLVPSFTQSDARGFGLRVPYFFALSDSYDATVAGTYYSKQGFLGEVEFRQAFGNGYYTLQAAGLSQQDPQAFDRTTDPRDPITGVSLSPDYTNTERGMIGTTGRFALNEDWTFGWDILAQSDQNFSNTYDIENFNQTFHTSEVYLTGLGDRSFFDLRAQRFDIQTRVKSDQDVQPWVLPTFDYERIEDGPLGGEVQFNANLVNIRRDEADLQNFLLCDPDFFIDGSCSSTAAVNAGLLSGFPYRTDYFRRRALEGDYSRGTVEAEWRRTFTTDGGLVLTPFASLRGDLYRADMSTDGYSGAPTDPFLAINSITNPTITIGDTEIDTSGFRGMAAAGVDARYPIVIDAQGSTHVIEPIAQLIVRPNETSIGNLPNEDAQSLVFNTTNLFAIDKFSGYDRIEGGTRANVGLRYSGTYETGYTVNATAGESFHLAGRNSFADYDLALVGADSGLETNRSDYVGSVAVGTPIGLQFGVGTRLDEETLDVKRTDLSSAYSGSRFGVGLTYSQIAAQPIYGFPVDRSQAGISANVKLTKEWTAYGSLGYDIKNDAVISKSFGLGYLDECFSLLAQYTQTDDNYQLSDSQNEIMFKLSLRTVADAQYKYKLGEGD
ncbi:LPS-assembly protein LptD [Aureimonas endophytica]|uniref:LPS-assembly protein LptD n=1 Tax=Aureimonas endophytica TaxID=2027858 RepID=A0A917DYY6_9HYPH|nr:LPS-assembly protein LptD [Aureimonas endophytica]GGD85657.1 LPS-assembly protein LptD [Aureimonas endophytica]